MHVIKIESRSNGSHLNQKSESVITIPMGYAQIPDDMPIPDTFPFVNIEVAEETRYNEIPRYNEKTEKYEPELIPYTVTVVTSMTAGIMPEPVPTSEPETTAEELTVDDMANAILEGVNDI